MPIRPKLGKNIDQIGDAATDILGLPLTGYSAGTNSPISSSNTILSALEDLQAQISAGNGWSLTGNTLGAATSKLGSLDNFDWKIIRNNIDYINFTSTGINIKQIIEDNSAIISINPIARNFHNSTAIETLSYENCTLYDPTTGFQKYNWNTNIIYTASPNIAIDVNNRLLKDGFTGFASLDFENRKGINSSNVETISWETNTFTGNWSITGKLNISLSDYATNALALAGGLVVGDLYRTSGVVMVVI